MDVRHVQDSIVWPLGLSIAFAQDLVCRPKQCYQLNTFTWLYPLMSVTLHFCLLRPQGDYLPCYTV